MERPGGLALFCAGALAFGSAGPLACARADAPNAAQDAPDDGCLDRLERRGVAFSPLGPTPEIQTPIEVKGPIGAIALTPRGRRSAVMDCALAEALLSATPIFAALGLTRLAFSAAHDHRTRRGSTRLSAHAYGRAIDVHAFDGPAGPHDVERDFEKGVGRWIDLGRGEGPQAVPGCVGAVRSDRGKALRTLVCRLKLETSMQIIVTPDDDEDHRDHVHLEHVPAPATPSVASRPAAPSPVTARPVPSHPAPANRAPETPPKQATAAKGPARARPDGRAVKRATTKSRASKRGPAHKAPVAKRATAQATKRPGKTGQRPPARPGIKRIGETARPRVTKPGDEPSAKRRAPLSRSGARPTVTQ